MASRTPRWLVAFAVFAATQGAVRAVRADWPTPRHDARRTGTAAGFSNIADPQAYWRYFQGGAIGSTGAMLADCDGDGVGDLVVLSGGRAVAKRIEDASVLWRTALLALDSFVGAFDLDGDGRVEFVARSSNRVFVLRPADGSVVWSEPAGEMGTIGAVRAADLDGDGAVDLAIHECGCCSVNSGNSGFVYDFAGDIAAPQLRFTLPPVVCGGGAAFSVARSPALGKADLLLGRNDGFSLLDGDSGAVLGAVTGLGEYVQASRCSAADVDGDGAEELGCVLSIALGASGNGRRVLLLRRTSDESLEVVWQQYVGTVDGGVEIPGDWLGDLDGDGLLEMTLTGQTSTNVWSTYVYDAATGAELSSIAGERARAIASIGSNGRPIILTSGPEELRAFTFNRASSPPLQPIWNLPDRDLLWRVDVATAAVSAIDKRAVSLDLDQDGVRELLTASTVASGDLTAYSCSASTPTVYASYALPLGISPLVAWPFHEPDGSNERLAVAQSDGQLVFFDSTLKPQGSAILRFGGFYSIGSFRRLVNEPVISQLGAAPAALLVPDSRGAVNLLDASAATLGSGPTVKWSRFDTLNPAIVPGLAGDAPGISAVDVRDPDHHRVLALDAAGELLWSHDVGGITLSDLVIGRADHDTTPDVFVEWGTSNTYLGQWSALAGASGQSLWTSAPYGPGNRQPAGGAAADWNGDGTTDLVYQADSTHVLSGIDGSELVSGQPGYTYFMPILADVDGDGVDDVTLNAGYFPARTLHHDLQSALWIGQEDDRPYLYGSVVDCPGTPRLLTGSWQYPARLKFARTAGPDVGAFDVVWLGGGKAYPDSATALAAGAELGQLASPAVHANLSGDGTPVAVLGSTDGWLYGLDACAGVMRFAVNIGAPVGTVVFGDSDGDGLDEIIASAGDGFLYGLKQASIAAPAAALDTDPPAGITNIDIDEIWTDDTLYGAWDAVPDADGYEVAVVHSEEEGGGFVTDPPWVAVGLDTAATVGGLSLNEKRRYQFAVRALKAGSPSPDTLSDGVRVHLVTREPSGEAPESDILNGRACLCTAPGTSYPVRAPYAPLLAGLALAAARRRRSVPL